MSDVGRFDRADGAELGGGSRDALVRLAYRFLWNRDDAEDAVQSALARAHERAADLRSSDRWWAWVCAIVVQQCHTIGRRRRREADLYEHLKAKEPNWSDGEQGAADWMPADLRAEVRALLARLPQRQFEVLVLRHLQGMPYGTIGEILGISAATARVHARAGLEALRAYVSHARPDWVGQTSSRKDGAR